MDPTTSLSKRMRELARSNEDLSEFAFVASHDLQAPLRKIVAFAERVKALTAPDAPAAECVNRLLTSAERMTKLVDDVLVLAKVSAFQRPLESVNLDEAAAEALGDLEAMIVQTGAAITLNALPTIKGDRTQLRRLFQNLIANAIRFADPQRLALVTIASQLARRGCVEIVIEDNGVGVPPDQRHRLFKPFQRLHALAATAGSGLGLAICQKIVLRHRGAIGYEPLKPYGSRFIVTLPAHLREGPA